MDFKNSKIKQFYIAYKTVFPYESVLNIEYNSMSDGREVFLVYIKGFVKSYTKHDAQMPYEKLIRSTSNNVTEMETPSNNPNENEWFPYFGGIF